MCFLLSFAPLGARFFCLCNSLAIAPISKINLCSFDRLNMVILYCLIIPIKCAMFLSNSNPPFLALSHLPGCYFILTSGGPQFLLTMVWEHSFQRQRSSLLPNHTWFWSSILTVALIVVELDSGGEMCLLHVPYCIPLFIPFWSGLFRSHFRLAQTKQVERNSWIKVASA